MGRGKKSRGMRGKQRENGGKKGWNEGGERRRRKKGK